ncbi:MULTISPECIES: hypothetical protein [unclassified Bartonella]|uniref:hypothetical protein n=1 Tax=unclassified Bartonella TaxID=2645622 RepID=UPI00099986A7|nr:hypothetical protein BJB15x_010330 [Bartonella sp. JB15]AQX29675.1 hypothetical protein BJB63x_010190 [Bartonella sp. JB63]
MRWKKAKKARIMIRQSENKDFYSLHPTHQWSWEKIALYREAINAAMRKYVRRFPHDVCLKHMAEEIIAGKTQLWLILKNKTEFSAFVVTKIERTHDGKKRVVILDLAGQGGVKLVPLIDQLEQWARTIDADEILTLGRSGWAKILVHHGYAINLIHYRKVLTHEQTEKSSSSNNDTNERSSLMGRGYFKTGKC